MNAVAIVWLILAGIGVSIGYLWYLRRFVGEFVRRLADIDATSPETAVTAEQLHCPLTLPIRQALKEDGILAETVLKLGSTPERYYIPEKKLILAKRKFRKENTGVPFLILSVCVLIVTGVVFTLLYPYLSDAITGLFR